MYIIVCGQIGGLAGGDSAGEGTTCRVSPHHTLATITPSTTSQAHALPCNNSRSCDFFPVLGACVQIVCVTQYAWSPGRAGLCYFKSRMWDFPRNVKWLKEGTSSSWKAIQELSFGAVSVGTRRSASGCYWLSGDICSTITCGLAAIWFVLILYWGKGMGILLLLQCLESVWPRWSRPCW